MKKSPLVLVADDDERHRNVLATLLKDWNFDVLEAADGRRAVDLCGNPEELKPDLALLDVRMPGLDGLEALKRIKITREDMPVIIMTAYSEVEAAVDAMRHGAYDYLTKPLDFSRLEIILRNAIEMPGQYPQAKQTLAAPGSAENNIRLHGNGRAMSELRKMIHTIAPTEATVLITGESGTGKELAAKAIHAASRRANGPFVAVNCGALTETLLASELFGHEKGAFSGADKKHDGLFIEASGGSLFLDEVGEMSPAMQVKLLRVLQEREVLSVGGKKPRPINCRIMAATNRNLAEELEKGNFRQDLYYRLNVVNLVMPSLRERKEDIPELAKYFLKRFAIANHKRVSGITSEAIELMQSWGWPGNVRELENVVERGVILATGEYLGTRELPDRLRENSGKIEMVDNTAHEIEKSLISPEDEDENGEGVPTLEEVERKVIMQTLKRFGNNKSETAKALGITRKTLHARLNRYRDEDQGEK